MTFPRLRAPVVLVPGLFGFDRLGVGNWVLKHYFPGIPDAMTAAGNRVLVARLSPTAGIAVRAAQLRERVEQAFPGEAVHILAHSMGGLDARHLISRLGFAPRVLSLTTLGTPHRGSPFADWSLRRLGPLVEPVLSFLGVPSQAFHDLTVVRCRAFNEETPDAPDVRYFSVAGRFEADWLTPEWRIPARLIEQREGPCDGIVSLVSARWGEDGEVWDADHLNLANWGHPVNSPRGRCPDRLPDYARLLERLAAVE
jgi:triacylglycerol lipase